MLIESNKQMANIIYKLTNITFYMSFILEEIKYIYMIINKINKYTIKENYL